MVEIQWKGKFGDKFSIGGEEFYLARGYLLVSKDPIYPENVLKVASAAKGYGYHMVDEAEAGVLWKTEVGFRELMEEDGCNVLAVRKMKSFYDGPCELLENGDRRHLSDKPWDALSHDEQSKLLKAYGSLSKSNRAWED